MAPMVPLFWCFLITLAASKVKESLFTDYDINKALEISPTHPEDYTYRYFLLKRFKNNTKEAILTLLASSSDSIPGLLLASRIGSQNDSILDISRDSILGMFIILCTDISNHYLANRYLFYEPVRIYTSNNYETEDTLTTVWSRDASVVDKFFLYIYQNKIILSSVKKELEFLASYKDKRAFGLLGDIYFYGLNTPVDMDKALEYYMAGKALNDAQSFLGIGKILLNEPFNDTEQAIRLFDEAINIEKSPEALFQRYLIGGKSTNQNKFLMGMLQSSAMAGYLPAVNTIAAHNIQLNLKAQAITSFLSITQYSLYFIKLFDTAYEAFKNKDYKKSLMLYLYLNEFDLEVAKKNAIFLLKKFTIFPDQEKILFDIVKELSLTKKEYYKDVGDCYYNGTGVRQSYQQAFGYYLGSIGYSDESLYNVAYMFETGKGVCKNLRLAYLHISKPFKSKTSYLVVLYGKIRIGAKMFFTDYCGLFNPYCVTGIILLITSAYLYFLSTRK